MTKVVYKRLRKYWGWAYVNENKIELFNGLKGKQHLVYLLHEKLHLILPDHEEKAIRRISKDMAEMIWKENYRRVL